MICSFTTICFDNQVEVLDVLEICLQKKRLGFLRCSAFPLHMVFMQLNLLWHFFLIFLVNLTIHHVHAQSYCVYLTGVELLDETKCQVPTNSSSDCCSKCWSESWCGGYTWLDGQCYLKQNASKHASNINAISSIISAAVLTVPASLIYNQSTSFNPVLTLGTASFEIDQLMLRLTTASNDSQSAAVDLQPLQVLQDSNRTCMQASFHVSFSFKLNSFFGDGFSFIVMGTDSSIYDLGIGYMGWYTKNYIKGGMIAVEYDTKQDKDYNDPSNSHIGVNLNFNPTSNATYYNTSDDGITLSWDPLYYTWIDYDADEGTLKVYLQSDNEDKPSSPVLSYEVDLCSALRPPSCARCHETTAAYFAFALSKSDYDQNVEIFNISITTEWPATQVGVDPPSGQCSLLYKTTLTGDTIPTLNKIFSASANDCCTICSNSLQCKGYSWNVRMYCDLYYRVTGAQYNQDFVSGQTYPVMEFTPSSITISSFYSNSPIYLLGESQLVGKSAKLQFMDSQLGYVFLSSPVELLRDLNSTCQVATFNVSFSFNFSSPNNTFADGLALLILSSKTPFHKLYFEDNKGGSLGLRLQDQVITPGMLAVEFDTWNNGADLGDSNDNHIGIDLNFDPVSVFTQNTANFNITLGDSKLKYAWIDYDGFTNILKVFLSYRSTKPSTPILQYPINLCQLLRPESCFDCKTTSSAYFGISATSGYYIKSTDILGFSVTTTWTTITPITGTDYIPSLIPTGNPPKYLNKFFRYASVGYLSQSPNFGRPPTWLVASSWNWVIDVDSSVKDSRTCSSCFAMATADTVASSFFLANFNASTENRTFTAPDLSEQQILDCQSPGKCLGGWTVDSLDYSVSTGLVEEPYYPYLAMNGTCALSSIKAPRFKPTSFEKVDFYGWFGLLLAVMQQPVLVHVEASADSFFNYAGGVYSDSECYSEGVNHNMVLVGYDLISEPRFWILKNAWGTHWGERGYMRMEIQGGDGICGINTMPGYIPIFKARDPCNSANYPTLTGISANAVDLSPGRLNPCGGGVCTVVGNTNNCTCPNDFVAANNSDGTQTCVPSSPCTFMTTNPCNVGTCVNSKSTPGTYTCLCPIGYDVGEKASDSSITCVPAVLVTRGIKLYSIPAGFTMNCSLIYELYGIAKTKFLSQNKNLNCAKALPAGTVVNVTNDGIKGCKVPYAVSKGDNCTRIQTLFKIKSLGGVGSPNPDLDCSAPLQPGQQVCIIRRNDSSPPDFPICTSSYTSKPSDTCETVIDNQFDRDPAKFFILNPGLYCGNFNKGVIISNKTFIGQEVCTAAIDYGTSKIGCIGDYKTVGKSESCPKILRNYFCAKSSLFRLWSSNVAANRFSCDVNKMMVPSFQGRRLGFCAPKPPCK